MKPSARLKTVQDLLETFFADTSKPLDVLLTKHLRANRYIGSKDRRFIQQTLFDIIRKYLLLQWRADHIGAAPTPKAILLVYLVETGAFESDLFGQDTYGLPGLEDEDTAMVKALQSNESDTPDWANLNCPEWLYPEFVERFGDNSGAELQALNGRAPFNVRLNRLSENLEETAKTLLDLGLSPAKYSPIGYTSENPVALQNHPIYREGKIEIQDEGSQLAMLLVGAKPGMQVVDMCAGAGGKTLGLVAEVEGKGQIFAVDISADRLKQLHYRSQKASVRNIQTLVLPGFKKEANRKADLKPLEGKVDRVVLDVPCSGTGTWRRSPDNRFRLTREVLNGYLNTQKKLLVEGADLVKPGGRMVYITCSLLKSEGEAQISAFLKGNSAWKCLNYREILTERGLQAIPQSASSIPECLLLTPVQAGTDGFFVAVLEKT